MAAHQSGEVGRIDSRADCTFVHVHYVDVVGMMLRSFGARVLQLTQHGARADAARESEHDALGVGRVVAARFNKLVNDTFLHLSSIAVAAQSETDVGVESRRAKEMQMTTGKREEER